MAVPVTPQPNARPYYPAPYAPPMQPIYWQPVYWQPGPAYRAPRPQNGMGIAGMVVGIVALVFSFIPVTAMMIALPCSVIGACLSGVGVQRANQRIATNHGQAIAGLICSIIGGVLALLIMILAVSINGSVVG